MIDRIGSFTHFGFGIPISNELKERTVQAIAIAAIAVGSAYFLEPNIFRVGLYSSALLVTAAIYSGVTLLREELSLEQIARRTDRAARVILWSLMIVGALSAGLTLGSCLSGARLLHTGMQARSASMLIKGALNLTASLGFILPFSQEMLSNSTCFHERYESWVARLKALITDYQTDPDETEMRLVRTAFNYCDIEPTLAILEYLPIGHAQLILGSYLELFSDERLSALIDRIPDILTIGFLAQELPKDRFEKIVFSRFSPVELEKISNDVSAKEFQITFIEGVQEAKLISCELAEQTRKLQQLQEFIDKLPEKYADAQRKIDAARALKGPIEALLIKLTSREAGSLRQRLEAYKDPAGQIVTSKSGWVKVTSVVNHLFHVALIGGLLTLNFYYSPRSTAAGLLVRGFINYSSPARAPLITKPPVDYIHQGFSEQMRTLYKRVLILSIGLRLGTLGGFAAGMNLGDTALSYGNTAYASLRSRIS